MTGRKRRGDANPDPEQAPVEGIVVDPAAATRSGEDTRRRGWFWHWNSIVTQYAPLLGLKGVGLLNSYTVWTDRREESPHRGYAFPSQQSEADFYGEDRAELITINKILVALDLIEIRKEMVLRTDPQGRRWRVPHNLYRVKDHGDDFSLTARDVMIVAGLADRDKAVYRYVRRVFSPRFSPIDADNVWHAILTEVRPTELWQRLAERTEKEEQRASARTKAGHAARRGAPVADDAKGLFFVPDHGDGAATQATQNDSGDVVTPEASETIVASTNRGSVIDVDPANIGLDQNSSTMVDPVNDGQPTMVAPANTTYNQALNTTTTTTPDEPKNDLARKNPERPQRGGGPYGAPPPSDAPGEEAAIRAFAEANARPASPAERKLLAGLAERFSASADQAPAGAPHTGWSWVAAAIYEAVEAGSAFVAPRRLREILSRWEREGYPQIDADKSGARAPVASLPAPQVGTATGMDDLLVTLAQLPEVRLPHGKSSRRTWELVVTALAGAVERPVLAGLVAGTGIAGYENGEVRLLVPEPARTEQLATTYRELIERTLSEVMRRPVRLAVVTPDDATPRVASPVLVTRRAPVARPAAEPAPEAVPPPSFVVAESGLWSGQVWAAVLAELERHPAVGRADFEAWLRATLLLGRAGDGGAGSPLVVGVPHSLAQRRVSSRFQGVITAALAGVVGVRLPVEIVVVRDWLSARHPSPTEEERALGA